MALLILISIFLLFSHSTPDVIEAFGCISVKSGENDDKYGKVETLTPFPEP